MSRDIVAQQSWFDQTVGWSSIVSAAVAVLAVVLGIWIATTSYQTMALLGRRQRHIGPVVRDASIGASRYRFIRTSWSLLSRRVHSGSSHVREELIWLSEILPSSVLESELPGPDAVPIPFTFG